MPLRHQPTDVSPGITRAFIDGMVEWSLGAIRMWRHAAVAIRPVRQEKLNWCWAACAAMVANFRGGTLRQCEVVDGWLHDGCCSGGAAACDVPLEADDVVSLYSTLDLTAVRSEPLAHSDLLSALREGRPVQAGLRLFEGIGHAVLISEAGTDRRGRYITVCDPRWSAGGVEPAGRYRYEAFRRSLQRVWTDSWTIH